MKEDVTKVDYPSAHRDITDEQRDVHERLMAEFIENKPDYERHMKDIEMRGDLFIESADGRHIRMTSQQVSAHRRLMAALIDDGTPEGKKYLEDVAAHPDYFVPIPGGVDCGIED